MAGIEALGPLAAWLWMAVAAAFAAAELATRRRELLAGGLAAALTAVASWLAPGLDPAAGLGLFALLGIALVAIGRAIAGGGVAAEAAAALVGREAETVAFAFHEGTVRIDGALWPARLDGAASRAPRPGEPLIVVAADGGVVWVRPVRREPR